ncbi:hypothetical protein Nepgr_004768 [Nepenthes gracilis]|uniref:Auxin-responsive protein SAUR68-like n=1 Tax=Nepenthes gracilis TaxID=150966 RepID=A0AAD3S243_NEPGR|nr:hypothetical protein Nepgr_004768 [Nepenthes gracilis]
MMSSKNLIKIARKWQNLAALRRKRITLPKSMVANTNVNPCSTPIRADKGHFAVYSTDGRRFMIPLVYLQNEIISALLDLAEQEFGVPRDGPITLPCDEIFMDYALSLIQRNAARDLQGAFLMSVASGHCLSSSRPIQEGNNQPPICSF